MSLSGGGFGVCWCGCFRSVENGFEEALHVSIVQTLRGPVLGRCFR
jgi:hypothetical protein